jgi:hypothetical protein
VRFYFPDSQDQIDPSFDFDTEERSPLRVRQRDDLYAHELFRKVPYKGILVSKAMIDRYGGAGRYSAQQRQRFYRVGVREFFRLDERRGSRISTLGDCGAFTYIGEEAPPYSVDEVIDFYETAGFDAGVSVDHVIPAYQEDGQLEMVESPWQKRYELTLQLAKDFWERYQERNCSFEPVGVAQGWSPDTYAAAVSELESIGYTRIAIGGLVPLKTPQILAVMEAVDRVRSVSTEFHLFGVTRCESVPEFERFGATSFDSTSPFRQAFKDDRNNYHAVDKTFVALRVPQVEGNAKLQARIRSGQVDQEMARRLEGEALRTLVGYDCGENTLDEAVAALQAYELVHDGVKDRTDAYREVLKAKPWRRCRCEVCKTVGIQVMLFRGTERNKRRGFHNLHVFARKLEQSTSVLREESELIAA